MKQTNQSLLLILQVIGQSINAFYNTFGLCTVCHLMIIIAVVKTIWQNSVTQFANGGKCFAQRKEF